MKQAEIITELKNGAYIAVHYEGRSAIVYLNKIEGRKVTLQVRLTLRQVDALEHKGVIDEDISKRRGRSQFYYLK